MVVKNRVEYQVVARPVGRMGKLMAFASISLALVFTLGIIVGQWHANSVILKSIDLSSANKALIIEKEKMQSTLDKFDLLAEMNEVAISQLKGRLNAALQEKNEIEYALSFYENLVVTASATNSLEMFEFKAHATEAKDVYEFSILLGQDVRGAKTVSGKVDLLIFGAEDDDAVVEFTMDNSVMGFPLKYSFKYFQDLGGKIRLPSDFDPKRAAILVTSSGGRPLLETELDWILDS